jgi:hypothetical protein
MAALRPAYCSGVVGSSFIRARPGLARPSVLPLLCRANDCLSVVEVGYSRMVDVPCPHYAVCLRCSRSRTMSASI